MSAVIRPNLTQFTFLSSDATAITENTVKADIAGLSLALGAGETWEFEAYILVTGASGTPQIRMTVAGTEAATLIRFTAYHHVTSGGDLGVLTSMITGTDGYATAYGNVIFAPSLTTATIKIRGIVTKDRKSVV